MEGPARSSAFGLDSYPCVLDLPDRRVAEAQSAQSATLIHSNARRLGFQLARGAKRGAKHPRSTWDETGRKPLNTSDRQTQWDRIGRPAAHGMEEVVSSILIGSTRRSP